MAEETLASAVERERIHKLWQEKLAADPWNGWRALLGGWKIENVGVPVDPNVPFTGYYRTKRKDKTFAPVAYWYQDGLQDKLICLVDGKQIDPNIAVEQWPWVSRYPISHAWYQAVAERGEPWPDADARVSPQALSGAPYSGANATAESLDRLQVDRLGIGGNSPPEMTPVEMARNKIENAKGGLPDYKVISDDETLAKAKSLKNRLTELAGEADKERKALKEPHKKAGEIIDEAWMPLVKDAQAAAKTINDAMDAWATVKLQRLRAEEQRVRDEQAAADKIRIENEAKVRAAEAVGETAELETVPEVKPVATAPVDATVRPGYGRAATPKTYWHAVEITDIDALFGMLKTHKELKELMLALSQRAKDAGLDPPGVKFDERAKIRG